MSPMPGSIEEKVTVAEDAAETTHERDTNHKKRKSRQMWGCWRSS
ncbi:hypothetical protein L915_22029 [Phytophthora nicotianae]|uniref:Uncharacterized protein n=1 Tax=Phytophthora nicotianae TaxID=4792 RepID=W2HQA5_PHYNI|nr:hypothetical protein L915_22029 [Phytophthora nicotianae]ETL24144.1 hypothetical protein L916_21843 [Phytophthora nicotianae]